MNNEFLSHGHFSHGRCNDSTSRTEPPIISPVPERVWTSTSPSTEGRSSVPLGQQPWRNDSMQTLTGLFGTSHQGEGYYTFNLEPLTNKVPWSMPSPVSYGRRDHGIPKLPSRFPHGYAPQPLPNEPPRYRQHGVYRGRGMSCLLGAAGEDQDMGGGGGQPGPSNPTDAERLEQARALYDHERQRADRLEQEIENLRAGKKPGRDPL